jgi:hypothetical protein
MQKLLHGILLVTIYDIDRIHTGFDFQSGRKVYIIYVIVQDQKDYIHTLFYLLKFHLFFNLVLIYVPQPSF